MVLWLTAEWGLKQSIRCYIEWEEKRVDVSWVLKYFLSKKLRKKTLQHSKMKCLKITHLENKSSKPQDLKQQHLSTWLSPGYRLVIYMKKGCLKLTRTFGTGQRKITFRTSRKSGIFCQGFTYTSVKWLHSCTDTLHPKKDTKNKNKSKTSSLATGKTEQKTHGHIEAAHMQKPTPNAVCCKQSCCEHGKLLWLRTVQGRPGKLLLRSTLSLRCLQDECSI